MKKVANESAIKDVKDKKAGKLKSSRGTKLKINNK